MKKIVLTALLAGIFSISLHANAASATGKITMHIPPDEEVDNLIGTVVGYKDGTMCGTATQHIDRTDDTPLIFRYGTSDSCREGVDHIAVTTTLPSQGLSNRLVITPIGNDCEVRAYPFTTSATSGLHLKIEEWSSSCGLQSVQ
ncbi:MAG: hypothetical protein QM752_08235 [Gammaproteobacteria bacterium]